MTSSSPLLIEKPAEGVALIRINRPEVRNALDVGLRQKMGAHLAEFSEDPAVRCVVLTGDLKSFASGADIQELAKLGAIDYWRSGSFASWSAIIACTKPLIAAVNGFALGGGAELAMCCDIIIAGKTAKFGQPEVRLGVMPGGGGTQRLVRAMGKYRAMRFCLTGEMISGEEAYEMGLASEVVDDEHVLSRAIEMATRIAGFSPLAVEQIKEVIAAGVNAPLETALRLEAKAAQVLFASEDKTEGMKAFLEKRKAVWQGR